MNWRATLLIAAAAALVAAPGFLSDAPLRALTEIIYFALFAISYNLLFGYAGMLSFGHNASFGAGAYTFGYVLVTFPEAGTLVAAGSGLLVGAIGGALLGALCVRLRGAYFALMTLAGVQFLYVAAQQWRNVTKGDDGLIFSVPDISIAGNLSLSLSDTTAKYWVTVLVTIVAAGLAYALMQTVFGRSVVLVRENAERAEFIGYWPFAVKLATFIVASVLAALAGILFAADQALVSPAVFGITAAGDILVMVLLGGTRWFLAPVVGVAFYKILQDVLSRGTEHWQFFIGVLLVVVVLFSRDGLTGIAQRLSMRWGRG